VHGADLKRPQWLVIVARQNLSDPAVKCQEICVELGALLSRLDATIGPSHASPEAGA
jgi:hypothetical protein